MRHSIVVAAALLLSFSIPAVHAAGETGYPSRPIRFIAPFVPGGPSDILARLLSIKLNESMGQTVVVDNRGSAGGVVGFELGAKAAPDGYTLLIAVNSGLTINPHIYLKLPYDPQRDFDPITQLTSGSNVLLVHPSVEAKSVQELIALAKARPGKINFASTGTGNLLTTELFKSMAAIDIVNIPYKGTGQAVTDLVGGHIQMMMVNPLVAVPNVKAGKLRPLGVTSTKRSPVLPDVPTIAEQGLPGFQSIGWHAVMVPARTPKDIINRLHGELVKILNQPDVKERFLAQGVTTVGSTPDELRALIREESSRHAMLIKQLGLKAQ